MPQIHIQYNIHKALNIQNKEQLLIVNNYINTPTKLVFTRRKLVTEPISLLTTIREITVFRKKNVFGIMIEPLVGYNYYTFTAPQKIVPLHLPQLFERQTEGDLVCYVR